MTNKIYTLWREILGILREAITQIFVIHLAYIALGMVLFAPMAGLLGQFLLKFSGQSVLSDLDIVYFFLTPAGALTILFFASLTITILVFEQASLMAVCCAVVQREKIFFTEALLFTFHRVKRIFLFATLLVFRVLFVTLPFIGVALAIAWVLITDYDINYYLSVKPPIFIIAAVSISLVLLTMAVILIRHLCSWSLTLPLILFRNISPAHSFRESEYLTQGKSKLLLITLGIWALSGILLSSVVLGSIQVIGSILAPFFFDSLTVLIPVLGGLVALWSLANILVTVFTSGSFATLLILFYDDSREKITPEPSFTKDHRSRKNKFSLPLFATLLLTIAAVAVFVGAWLLKGIPADSDTMIIAHRGAAGKAPENTIASIDQAIKDGTDWVEIDVQETIDGKVVVIHDSDFMKLADVNLKVWNGTLKEIQKIDVGSWFNPKFSAERVPELSDVLELAKGKCRVLIELKYYGNNKLLEQRVAEIVEQAGMAEQVAIMSLKYEGIKNFRALRPHWPVGLLSTKAIGRISDLDVDFLAINIATAKPAFIRRIQSTGKQVYVWTMNDQIPMSRMISLGVDGIITDEPALAHKVRTKTEELNPVERLLLHTTVLLKTPIPKHLYRDKSP